MTCDTNTALCVLMLCATILGWRWLTVAIVAEQNKRGPETICVHDSGEEHERY